MSPVSLCSTEMSSGFQVSAGWSLRMETQFSPCRAIGLRGLYRWGTRRVSGKIEYTEIACRCCTIRENR